MSDSKKIMNAALRSDPGDAWSESLEVDHDLVRALPHLVHDKRVAFDGVDMFCRITCTCGAVAHIGVTSALSASQRHDYAHRHRMGIVAALHSCICCWPLEVEPTTTGHSEACPSHAMLAGTMIQLRPGQCCARDVEGVGSCDLHSAPGALRSVRERERVLKGGE